MKCHNYQNYEGDNCSEVTGLKDVDGGDIWEGAFCERVGKSQLDQPARLIVRLLFRSASDSGTKVLSLHVKLNKNIYEQIVRRQWERMLKVRIEKN